MSSDDSERDDMQEDAREDLELADANAESVSGGDTLGGLPVMKKLPGAKKWGDLTMKKGRTDSSD